MMGSIVSFEKGVKSLVVHSPADAYDLVVWAGNKRKAVGIACLLLNSFWVRCLYPTRGRIRPDQMNN